MYAIGSETSASGIGEKNLPVAACWFAEPGFQHGDRGSSERYTTFLAALPDHANMSTCTECDILACQPGHFRQTEARLCRHPEEGVIAPAKPGVLIGRGEQCLDLRTGEKMHLSPRETLAGDGQHSLDLGSMVRRFERSIPKEGVDSGQPQIPTACA